MRYFSFRHATSLRRPRRTTQARKNSDLTFLGIQLDTITQKATLPEDKLHNLLLELLATLTLSREQGSCTKRQLLSLIGKLSFATKVKPAGRIFLRRLLDLAHSITSLEDSLIIGPEAVPGPVPGHPMLARVCTVMEWHRLFPQSSLDPGPRCSLVHGRLINHRLWGILGRSMVQPALATTT